MKIRPSVEYWNALDSSIREKILAYFDKKLFYFGLILILAFTVECFILLFQSTS